MSGDWQNESPRLDTFYKISPHPFTTCCASKKPALHSLREWLSANVLLTSDSSYWMNKGYISNERKSIEAVSLLVNFRPPGQKDAITQNQTQNPDHKTLISSEKWDCLTVWKSKEQTDSSKAGRRFLHKQQRLAGKASLHGDDWQTL